MKQINATPLSFYNKMFTHQSFSDSTATEKTMEMETLDLNASC